MKHMSTWVLPAIAVQIFLVLSVVILWLRQARKPKDDPRLTRGLQLLQSKIAVLEDLSERTEHQVQNLTQFLDERSKHLQTKILDAEELLVKLDHSMKKSLDVAEIFQDKIPHEEIIERGQTQKYVTAAKMANDGRTVDEIVQALNLPRSEVEFIAKVNRDELTFEPSLLPEWAKPKELAFQPARPDLSSLKMVEGNFRQAVKQAEDVEQAEAERRRQADERIQAVKQSARQVTESARHVVTAARAKIRKVEFPRIG